MVLDLNTMFLGVVHLAMSLRTCLRNVQTVQIVVIHTKRLYKTLVSSSEGGRGEVGGGVSGGVNLTATKWIFTKCF